MALDNAPVLWSKSYQNPLKERIEMWLVAGWVETPISSGIWEHLWETRKQASKNNFSAWRQATTPGNWIPPTAASLAWDMSARNRPSHGFKEWPPVPCPNTEKVFPTQGRVYGWDNLRSLRAGRLPCPPGCPLPIAQGSAQLAPPSPCFVLLFTGLWRCCLASAS